jgi:tetratricopeptide (TPR) repeat protein
MTANHLLLYRLAELMLAEQQHLLSVDLLFDDEQIGEFVKSIQIDSPYQQMLLEGVLTETVKEDKLYVTFTVEGYFHFVLGEVIFNQSIGKGPEFLKDIIENNKLNGAKEGVEQCLIRDVENDVLSRFMWLIDQGGTSLEVCSVPLAHAFLQVKGNQKTDEELEKSSKDQIKSVMDELLADPTENDIEVLEKAIGKLESSQLNEKVSTIYKEINAQIEPKNIKNANLYVESIKYIPEEKRSAKLDRLNQLEITAEDEEAGAFYISLGEQYDFIADYDMAIDYYEKSLAIYLKVHGPQHPKTGMTYNNLGLVWSEKGEYDKAIDYYEKSLAIDLNVHGDQHPSTGTSYGNLGIVWQVKGVYDKAIEYYEKSLAIDLNVHGNQHPSTGKSYNNLGRLFQDTGDYSRAIDYYEKSLDIGLKVHGDQHSDIGMIFNNLGAVLKEKGDYAKAIYYYEKSLEIHLKVHGHQHSNTAIVYGNLGEGYNLFGEYTRAIELIQLSLKINLDLFDINHPITGITYYKLGDVWKNKGDKNRAEIAYKKALAILDKNFGNEHYRTLLVQKKLKDLNDR